MVSRTNVGRPRLTNFAQDFVKNAVHMGDVCQILGVLRVYLALRRIERWAVDVYAPWFQAEILGREEA
jgi:hypothetical protein